MAKAWNTFTVPQWDAFTANEWDSFLADAAPATRKLVLDATAIYTAGAQSGDVFSVGGSIAQVFTPGAFVGEVSK